MKKYRFYLGRLLLMIVLLIFICAVYNIIYYNISSAKLIETKNKTYKIGNLLGISEDRINYINSFELNKMPFSVEAIMDEGYYIACFKIGYIFENKSLFDITRLSTIPFLKKEQDNFLTGGNYIRFPPTTINNPFSVLFNTQLFPNAEIKTIEIYTDQNDYIYKDLSLKGEISFITESKNISFSLNRNNEEEMLVNSYYEIGYRTNIIISKDDKSNVYIICLSPKIDIIEDKRVISAPFKTLKELREVSN